MSNTARTEVEVRVRWEGAHRLPRLGGKCAHLHGHSWQAWFTFTGRICTDGIIADLGLLKADLQTWVDENLDHAAMLGQGDPLTFLLEKLGSRVYVFGIDDYTTDLPWPTVENVARLLHGVATADAAARVVELVSVTVQETENNRATVRTVTS